MATCPRCHRIFADSQTTCSDDGEVLVPSSAIPRDHELVSGEAVGEYVVEERIGGGTFGDVYRAVQPVIGKQVAIKVLSRRYSADPSIVSRFIAEARAVNQIRHKHIIDIFSFGQLPDGRHYHIMELLSGTTLDVYLKEKGRLSVTEALRVLHPLGRALDAAHACGIAHRDLKPANVFLSPDDDGHFFPKLLDFGIAKLMSDELPRQHQTASGAAVGTPDYMSPEQSQGSKVDHRTDVYAFGVMTYQLLTGRLPFVGDNVVDVLVQQIHATPEPPSKVCSSVPAVMDAPILAMLAKDRDARPSTLAEALHALEAAARSAGLEVPLQASTGDLVRPVLRPPPPEPAVEPAPPRASDPPAWADDETLPSPPRGAADRAERGRGALALALSIATVIAIGASMWLASSRHAVVDAPADVRARDASSPWTKHATSRTVDAELPPDAEVVASAEPDTIELSVRSVPAGAEVVAPGDVVLGTTPCAVRLPRAAQTLRLELRAPGYKTLVHELVPLADRALDVTLERKPVPRPASKRRTSDDLEEPFR